MVFTLASGHLVIIELPAAPSPRSLLAKNLQVENESEKSV
jgi:hypothetical protein